MDNKIIVKEIKRLLKDNILGIPDYLTDIILSNSDPDTMYYKLGKYIVEKDKKLISQLENSLKNYIENREKLQKALSNLLNYELIKFNTRLKIIYYLNKDINNLSVFNNRLMAFIDYLHSIKDNKDNK